MKKTLCLLLALTLLCGCSTGEPAPSTEESTQESTEETAESTEATEETEESSEATEGSTVPEVLYINPLTGEAMDEPSDNRPYCIMLNNSKAAMPQYGVGQADILYETLIEGETRCMGVYFDLEDVDTFGAIRSARKYFIQLAMAYDAVYVHAGRSDNEGIGAKQYFEATGWDHIDGVHGPGAESYYYRDADRQAAGYAYEHTLFIRPQNIIRYASKMGCTLTRDGGVEYGYQFNDDTVTVGSKAQDVTVWFNMSGTPSKWHKSTSFAYHADDKLYYASQYGTEYVDGATGQTLAFRNVLVLRTSISVYDSQQGHLDIKTVGSGTGYYFCNGMMVEIEWSRESVYDPFTYTLKGSDTELTFGVGKTYIALVPNAATVEYK